LTNAKWKSSSYFWIKNVWIRSCSVLYKWTIWISFI